MEESLGLHYKEEDKLILNYLMLVQAILFSDYDDGQDFCVCLYDTEENDRLVAVFNNDATCSRFLKTSKRVIQSQRIRRQLIKWRFKTERFRCGTTSSKAEYYQIMMGESNRKELNYLTRKMNR